MSGLEGSQARSACALARLADVHVEGALLGLTPTEAGFSVHSGFFPCCTGSGLRLDIAAGTTHACPLGKHLREVRRVHRLWQELYPDEGAQSPAFLALGSPQLRLPIARLAALAGGGRPRGLAWQTAASGTPAAVKATGSNAKAEGTGGRKLAGATGQPAVPPPTLSVWSLALAAAWRFALKPHVVILGKTPASAVIPPIGEPAPQLLCLGEVDGLWEPYAAEQVEALVGYAYGAMLPLFLQLSAPRGEAQGAAPGYASTRQFFARRLSGLKAKSPLTWLDPACVAKLPSVCDGLEGPLARARADWAAVQPAAPSQVRLPWDR